MKLSQANSRQHPVVLNLVFQRSQLLCNGLAFLGLFAILLGRDSFVHIVDGTGLMSIGVNTCRCFAMKDGISLS